MNERKRFIFLIILLAASISLLIFVTHRIDGTFIKQF